MRRELTIKAFNLIVGDLIECGDSWLEVCDIKGFWANRNGFMLHVFCQGAEIYMSIHNDVKVLRYA